jgi:hypothetical protein
MAKLGTESREPSFVAVSRVIYFFANFAEWVFGKAQMLRLFIEN